MEIHNQPHVIERQVFEVEYFSRAEAHGLQDRLIKLFNDRIMGALEELFNRMVLPNEHFNLSDLIVDIGKFSENWDEEELVERIIMGVEQELSMLLNRSLKHGIATPDPDLLLDSRHKPLHLLDHFLLHGSLPWWVAAAERPKWSEILTELYAANKSQLRTRILNAGKLAHVRSRIVHQFNDPDIYLLLQLIEPDYADYIKLFHSDLLQIQQEEQVVKSDSKSFKEAVWEFILDYLLVENQAFFSKIHFVEATLMRFAAHFNLSYATVLALFVKAVPVASRQLTTDLPKLLLLLSLKNGQQSGLLISGPTKAAAVVFGNFKPFKEVPINDPLNFGLIGYYLFHGRMPAWAEEDHIQLSDLASLFEVMINTSADLAIKLIKYLAVSEQARYRFLILLSGEALIAGLAKLFPESGKGYVAFRYLIEKFSKVFSSHDLLRIEKTLASVFLTEFEAAGYAGLRVDRFFEASIHYVSAFAGLSPVQLIRQLLSVMAKAPKARVIEFDNLLRNFLGDKEFLAKRILPDFDYHERLQQSDQLMFIDAWLNDQLIYKSKDSNAESFKVLHYFLQFGHLPDQYGFTENESQQLRLNLSDYIRKYWFSLNSSAWVSDLPPLVSEQQALEILEAILYKSGQKQWQTFSTGDAVKALEILNHIFKNTQNLPDGWIINDSQLALRAIRHFMSTGSLPSHYAFSNARAELALLRQLIKIANKGHQLSLSEIFQKAAFQGQAIVKLLKLVYLPEEDVEISKILERFVDKQLLNAFTDWGFHRAFSHKELNILAVFSEVKENRTKIFLELLANTQLRSYMAKRSAIEDIMKIMDQEYASWNAEELVASKGAYHWMVAQMNDSLEKEHLAILFKEFFLLQLTSQERFTDAAGFFSGLLKFLASKRNVIFRQLLKAISSEVPNKVLFQAVPKLIRTEITRFSVGFLARDQVEKQFLEADLEFFNANHPSSFEVADSSPKYTSFENDFELSGVSFLVHNAGLVLLHPYLKTFFANLGLLKEGKFISKKARFKAIHALQFLIDGELEHAEDMLILSKILCGWPVKAPVPLSVSLSTAQLQHCEDFISAVLSMWAQMKNSSHSNFRGSFLKRDGLLRNEAGDWSLRVEPRGYDVLLQTLPWGYSVVKTSLMETIIYVEWI
ncbi:contractile injection system tape measure protein [Pedobacter gandavensis]|uniref:ATP-binding protein n=1 Tax=Pedobacter gandavensis TaxID=2679963 RepID=A0ABR6ERQ9_9SPHI|nr:contractile injection system tape measure protein [Pedobacter gandavensis]MBB2147953.1 hypothetical protein [Pedobacter gandavensis]